MEHRVQKNYYRKEKTLWLRKRNLRRKKTDPAQTADWLRPTIPKEVTSLAVKRTAAKGVPSKRDARVPLTKKPSPDVEFVSIVSLLDSFH
jgi:hypothetical protein